MAVRIPHPNRDGVVIVFHTELDASFGAPGSLWRVRHVEDVRHAAHESHGARSRVKVSNFAFDIVHFRLPWLDRRWFQGLLELFGREAIANG